MKRTLSLLVVLAMLLGMVGVTALTLGEEPTQVDIVFLVNDEKYERKAILGEKAKAPQIDVPAGYCLRWDPEDLIVRKADQEFVGVFVAAEAPAPAPVTEPEPAPAPAEQPEAPADEPEVTADEPEVTADEPEAPAEGPAAPAEEPEAPADEPEVTADEPKAPAEEPKAPAEEPEAPAEEPVAPAPAAEPEPAPAEQPEAPAEEPEAPAEDPEVTLAEVMNSQPAEEHEQAAPKTKQPVGETVTVTTATDVRQAADGLSPIFATVAAGTVLPVLGREGDWLKVEAEGQIGFIYQPVQPDPEQPKEYAPKKVTIFTSRRVQMTLGEKVSLTSIIEGFEDCEEIFYQWECDKGSGFEEIVGANSATYGFEAAVESLSWDWRLQVYYR